ncbi:uncharacterized protein LOC141639106 [Silene latifolia]|uniref:uncharacterized protein LOC141639106 n=1 Tax=Silene latifolia TaxID=37657 RepID=UPI003D78012B
MVLIDENTVYIHVIIKSNIAHSFRGVLNEGSVYMIKNFSVIDNKSTYRVVSDNKLMIQFYSNTVVKEVTFDLHKIPEDRFDLIEFEKLPERIGKIYILTDVLGEIIGEGKIDIKQIKGREIETLEIELNNLRKKTVKITLWGKAVEDYQKETSVKGVGNRVGVFTSNLVKEYQNTMYLSTTPASKVYFNLQMPEVEEFNSCLSDGPIKVLEIPKKGVDACVVIAKKKRKQLERL